MDPNSTTLHTEQIDNVVNLSIKLPPSIFVKGIEDFPELCFTLIEIIGVDNIICKLSADKLKIQTVNPESYRRLSIFLKKEPNIIHTNSKWTNP